MVVLHNVLEYVMFKFKFKNFNYPTRGNFVVVMAGSKA